jgi:precorrin-2/cobalt-factor-2 C20-methyltransferase
MTYGTLYGVGAGPGATDLMTLRAAAVLRRVPVLALPRSSDYGASKAWEIVGPVVKDGAPADQERLFLTFPMNKDPERLRPAWDRAFDAIGARLERGLDVAFVTEGDPSLFSTFVYLREEAPRRWPGVAIEIVPGVSSVMAVAAVTGVPLADGQERIAILPVTYGIDDLTAVVRAFDTIVLMKLGPELPRIVEVLEREGLLDRAVYVSRATMRDQRIVRDLRTVTERGDCFAMVIVSKKERSGVLAGTQPSRPLELAGGLS